MGGQRLGSDSPQTGKSDQGLLIVTTAIHEQATRRKVSGRLCFQIEERGKETHSMRLRFKVIEVGWGIDFDNNRHPRIRMGRRNWSAVLYDHPTEGWQVISLEIVCKAKRDTRTKEYDGDPAESKMRELVGGEMVFANADVRAIENDLYEIGRKGAAKRWVGKTITLNVDKAK
jgi:hypothetical protein